MDIIYLMKREMNRRRYSQRTIETYEYCFNEFLKWCKKEPRKVNSHDIKEFLYMLSEKNKSASTMNIYLNAIKFPLENILNKKHFFIDMPFSKVPKKLPIVLSKEEVSKLIENISNNKHKLMIKLMYSAGLRVSELLNLKIEDFDFENNLGWVRQGKGNKDRIFIIAGSIKEELKEHIKNNCQVSNYLFTSNNHQLSTRTVQEIIKAAAKKSNLRKKVHPHTLRHSFATHLIENGYDITSVQSLLGHSSVETTMVYVHIASKKLISVKSPLDSL